MDWRSNKNVWHIVINLMEVGSKVSSGDLNWEMVDVVCVLFYASITFCEYILHMYYSNLENYFQLCVSQLFSIHFRRFDCENNNEIFWHYTRNGKSAIFCFVSVCFCFQLNSGNWVQLDCCRYGCITYHDLFLQELGQLHLTKVDSIKLCIQFRTCW